jgi:hypothetical protein
MQLVRIWSGNLKGLDNSVRLGDIMGSRPVQASNARTCRSSQNTRFFAPVHDVYEPGDRRHHLGNRSSMKKPNTVWHCTLRSCAACSVTRGSGSFPTDWGAMCLHDAQDAPDRPRPRRL